MQMNFWEVMITSGSIIAFVVVVYSAWCWARWLEIKEECQSSDEKNESPDQQNIFPS